MIRIIWFAAGLALAVPVAMAEEYWIAYEGNDFPENVGWPRRWGNEDGPQEGGAERWIEDGVFVLDSLRHDWICDFYEIQRAINPGPGELFVAEWRLRVDEPSDFGDVGVVIARDAPAGHVGLKFGTDAVGIEPGDVSLSVEPGVFHAYRFESQDMDGFDFFVDGELLHHGVFEDFTLLESFVNFGDGVQGRRSLSRWDYFRFGAVPEPNSALLFAFAFLSGRALR